MLALIPWIILGTASVVFPVLFFIPAPYGRYQRRGWGPSMPSRAAWLLMESVSVFLFAWAFLTMSPFHDEPAALWLAGLWLLHYLQRAFIYPLKMRDPGKGTPLLTVAMAVVFNSLNAISNGAALAPRTLDLKVVLGALIFFAGFAINLHSDAVLRGLRKPGESGYAIPYGGLYKWVSCPNYLGELLEWTGFAIAAWTFPALAFAVFTFANLFPRAIAHHRWYREKFPDYPKDRTAIIPFLGRR
ncbi:MAG: 3-oxo-5-alpha-steroid 4-dehydrogenase [Myxococcaceae bacterium]|nr:3-oxo-5-alpha-steroid 4-dehydrogenase [Myxococcaceae bacterium]